MGKFLAWRGGGGGDSWQRNGCFMERTYSPNMYRGSMYRSIQGDSKRACLCEARVRYNKVIKLSYYRVFIFMAVLGVIIVYSQWIGYRMYIFCALCVRVYCV